MKRVLKIGRALVLTSMVGMYLPGSLARGVAAETNVPAAKSEKLSLDVVLSDGGTLRGSVVDAKGQPCKGAKVVLRQSAKDSKEAIANDKGEFQISGLKPGVQGMVVSGQNGSSQKIVRLWLKDTAPPSASPVAVVAVGQDQDVVRGQDTVVVTPTPPPPPEDDTRRRRRLLGWLLVGGAAGGIAAGIATSAGNGQDQPVIPQVASP